MNRFRVRECPFCGNVAITGFEYVNRNRTADVVHIHLYTGCPECNIFKGKTINIVNNDFDSLSNEMSEVIQLWNERN